MLFLLSNAICSIINERLYPIRKLITLKLAEVVKYLDDYLIIVEEQSEFPCIEEKKKKGKCSRL